MQIVSYREALKARHRIHDILWIDLRDHMPEGIPLLGAIYFAAFFVTATVLYVLPVIGAVALAPSRLFAAALAFAASAPVLPYQVFAYVAFPLMAAVIAVTYDPDGRPAHLAAISWLGYLSRRDTRHRSAGRPVAMPGTTRPAGGDLPVRWDNSDTRELRSGRVTGPATVTFSVPWREDDEWRAWVARPGGRETGAVQVPAGRDLWVKP